MSVQAMSWVLEESETRGEERLVLLSIANHASMDDGHAWPSIGQIAKEANVHPDTAKRLVRKLHRDGHVTRDVQGSPDERVPHYKRSNLYVIHLDHDLIAKLREERQDRGDDATPRGDTSPRVSASPGGQNVPGGGGQNVPGTGGSERPPKPSVEPSRNHHSCDESGFDEFWSAYPPRNGKRIGKAPALAQWRKLSAKKRATAMKGVVPYAAHCRTSTQFAKDAVRWLRDGLYEEWASEEVTVAVAPPPAPMPVYVADEKRPDWQSGLRHLQSVRGKP